MPTASGLTVTVRVDDRAVLAGLREQRRAINQDVKRLTLEAAQSKVLPLTRTLAAPSRLRRTIIARSTTRGAYLTSIARGMDRRILGLLNFGGVVRTVLVPKSARALPVAPGAYRAAVRGPRTYRGKRFLERSVDLRLPAFSEQVERELTRLMQSRLAYARAFSS